MTEQIPTGSTGLLEDLATLAGRNLGPDVADIDRMFAVVTALAAAQVWVGRRIGLGPMDLATRVFNLATNSWDIEAGSTYDDALEGDQGS